jgi:hypothetical protein
VGTAELLASAEDGRVVSLAAVFSKSNLLLDIFSLWQATEWRTDTAIHAHQCT